MLDNTLLEQKTAIILVENRVGLGNISFAIKLANSIKKMGYDSHFILTGHDDDAKALATLGAKASCVEEIPENCAVCFAVIDFSPNENILTQLKEKKNVNIIILSQYDMEVDESIYSDALKDMGAKIIKTGIGPESEGIFLEEQLITVTDEKRNMDIFEELPDTLQQVLLNDMVSIDYDYFKLRSLSLAYTSDMASLSIPILHAYYHHFSENKLKNHDLIMIDKKLDYNRLMENNTLLTQIEKIYGKITFINLDQIPDEKAVKTYITGNEGPEFRLILSKSIPSSAMHALYKLMGHGFCTITGDQSFSEAISRICPFYYFCPPWKEELFGHLISEIPILKTIRLKMIKGDYEIAAKLLYENQKVFIEFCENIHNKKNLELTIFNQLRPHHNLSSEKRLPDEVKTKNSRGR